MAKIYNKEDNSLETMRHSCEHVLHQALVELFPGLKRAMGPATEEGFYTDFDYHGRITEEDFPKIEKRMAEIIKADLPFVRQDLSLEKARKLFADNEYKLDWIDRIKKSGERPTVYWTGHPNNPKSDVDLCSGPHVESTGKIGPFKLLSVAGAYWHGDEKNKMLTRIYGTCAVSKQEFDKYVNMLQEAQKRDHKKLGPALELFMFHETSPGMPYWLPKGVIVLNELIKFWRHEHAKRGYQEIMSPLLNKKQLYVTSGHFEHYWQDMFISETAEHDIYGVKAMNCPNSMIVFGSKTRSYKDLPLRLSDTDPLHRFERSGTLNGLFRVREFRQDDAHIFVSEEQIKDEYRRIFEIVELFYSVFQLDYSFRLGTRPKSFMGDLESWNMAEATLRKILEDSGKNYSVTEGDGAFYGPKVDILMQDAIGRSWQMGTIQLDFQQPKRFELKYTAADGSQKTPVVIHRVIYGSLERFIGLLIEHFSGALPAWLSPIQVQIISITDRNIDYAKNVLEQLISSNIRAEIDSRPEKMQSKIRDAQIQKIPYMLICGDREQESNQVAVRTRQGQSPEVQTLQSFISQLNEHISKKQLD